MANVSVKENHLRYDGQDFFRGNASEVDLGSVGEKRTPVGKQNYLEVKDRIPVPKIDVAKSTIVDIDFNTTTKNAFNSVVSAIVKGIPVKFTGDVTRSKLRSGDLKLVKFSVINRKMIDAANKSPRVIEELIHWGKDARIAHQVFVVMDAQLATKFHKKGSASLSLGPKGLQASLGGEGEGKGNTKVEISKGTCFAYLLAKIDWDAKQKKNKSKIVDLDDDQWGMN